MKNLIIQLSFGLRTIYCFRYQNLNCQFAQFFSNGWTFGGGGLGNLAIQYVYQWFDVGVMFATIIVLIFLVQFIQILGDRLARGLRKK